MITQMQHLLDHSACKYQNKMAVSYAKKAYTFQDILTKANSLSHYLQNNGVKRGDRIVVLLGNTIETVISFWGILKAGAIVIPVGKDLKPNKIDYILKDSGAIVLITNNTILSNNLELLKAQKLDKVLVIDPTMHKHGNTFEDFQNAVNTTKNLAPLTTTLSIDLAAIIYTSGSTGEP